jgi:hypothetical protein
MSALCYRLITVFSVRDLAAAMGGEGRRRANDCDARTSGTADRNIAMQQPESTSTTLTVSPGLTASPAPLSGTASDPSTSAQPGSRAPEQLPHRVPRWLERVELFLRVMLRMYIGLAICYAPWSHNFWDQNPIFLQSTALADFVRLGAVRGIVSGLGLLNLWFAFQDAIRRRDG